MDFNKNKIKNINCKLLAGALTLTIITTTLSGCTKSKNNFKYNIDSQGQYEVTGTINYEFLKNCYFTVIEEKNFNTLKFYITKRKDGSSHYCDGYRYNDILRDKQVFSRNVDSDISNEEKNNLVLITEIELEDYLYSLGKIKTTYTSTDVEEILNLMKEEYLKVNDKTLVKK